MPVLGVDVVLTPLSATVIVWNEEGKLPTNLSACPDRVILPVKDILILEDASETNVCLNGSATIEEEPAHIKINLVVCEPKISCIQYDNPGNVTTSSALDIALKIGDFW